MNELAKGDGPGHVSLYDPEKGLETIVLAEAGEKHFARAKDAKNLFKAVETKIRAQAEYVVWRDGVVVRGGDGSNQHQKRAKITVRKSLLPTADPGEVTAWRWRQKLTSDGAIDDDKLGRALATLSRRKS